MRIQDSAMHGTAALLSYEEDICRQADATFRTDLQTTCHNGG